MDIFRLKKESVYYATNLDPYPSEFREQIVSLVRSGRSVESLAQEYERCAATIHDWVRQHKLYSGLEAGTTTADRDRMKEL